MLVLTFLCLVLVWFSSACCCLVFEFTLLLTHVSCSISCSILLTLLITASFVILDKTQQKQGVSSSGKEVASCYVNFVRNCIEQVRHKILDELWVLNLLEVSMFL